MTLAGTLPGRNPLMRAVRDSSRRRPPMWVSRRSAGRLKLMRRSRLPTDSTETCILTDSCGHGMTGALLIIRDVRDQGAAPLPTELASFADSAAGCQQEGNGRPPQPRYGLPTLPQGEPPPDAAPARRRRGPPRRRSLPFADIKTVMSGRSAAQPCRVPPSQGGTHGPRSPAGRRQCAFMIMPSGIRGAWCERRDSNPHGGYPLEPKSSASTNSATFA